MERVVPGMTPIRRRRNHSQTQTPSRRSQKPGGEPQTLEGYVQELVSGELAQSLFTVTQKIHKKLPEQLGGGDDEESVFPVLPGSHLKFTNPALEFVKSLCKVLSLDTAITDQVNKLRRNLLKLINVGEFSDSADWKDPCISFVLPEVSCFRLRRNVTNSTVFVILDRRYPFEIIGLGFYRLCRSSCRCSPHAPIWQQFSNFNVFDLLIFENHHST